MFRWHVISAVFKRNLMSYFSGLLGYLFIIVFVVASAYFTFQPEFFTHNLPTLDLLTEVFPWLLLFIVPAITMNLWADERRSGTDELLFTLPGTDMEIMIGKYLSAIAIYTIALFFSTTQLFVLSWLSTRTDWGIVLTTYLGYWFAGCALLTAGMLASGLTRSTPVAFVLGSVLCVTPVMLEQFNSDTLRSLSVAENLRDFSIGLISFSSVMYFISLAAIMLYLNYIVIAHRHWSARGRGEMSLNFAIRTLCIFGTVACWTYVSGYAIHPADFSEEKLYTLTETTSEVIEDLDEDNPVEIQAFISQEVPRDYLETRKTLISLLNRLEKIGGDKITVRRVELAPYDDRAAEAETLGVTPVVLREDEAGRTRTVNVFLGAMVKSSRDQVVIPFFGKGLPLEYELAKAIQTVSQKERLKVGILKTDAEIVQEDISRRSREWELTRMLRMHYEVVPVDPNEKIDRDAFDVLLVVMPSSLEPNQMPNLVEYVGSGAPAVIFADPVPLTMARVDRFGRQMLTVAPRLPKPAPGGPMAAMMGNRQPPPPKADGGKATSLLDVLQIGWQYDQIVWDEYNPHLELDHLGGEFLFISPESGLRSAISQKSPITSGMQEILAFHSGTIQPVANMNEDRTFTPLLRTSRDGVLADWNKFVESGFDVGSFGQGYFVKPLDSTDLAAFFIELSYDETEKQVVFKLLDLNREEPFPVKPEDLTVVIDDPAEEDGRRELKLTAKPAEEDAGGEDESGDEDGANAEGDADGEFSVFVIDRGKLPGGSEPLSGAVRVSEFSGDYISSFFVSDVTSLSEESPALLAMAQRAAHVIAARIEEKGKVNTIFVADLDMISNMLFSIREQGGIPGLELQFDNVSFLMNAIDVLAGDETFVELRKRRPKLRTLTTLQRQRDKFIKKRNEQKQRASNEAANQLKAARQRFEEKKEEIEENESLDDDSKRMLIRNLNSAEARRVEVAEINIEREKEAKINKINREMERSIREIENNARWKALLLSPLPACVLGIAMMIQILVSEKKSVVPERSVK
jgi:ABC-2 type transport system permease protein